MGDPYAGKCVVVGLTFEDLDDQLIGHAQFHCRIARINPLEGIVLERLDGGPTFNLPPALELLQPATLHEYRFNTTGEVVHDPDFELTMKIGVPPAAAEAMRAGTRPLEPGFTRGFTGPGAPN
ncbi:MAG TPA: hypothetical protein VFJ82_22485 [Longimicrobium sp.]|nr:hypothetical protein [Longimicrobium sp.]